jgi:hypothetical protein
MTLSLPEADFLHEKYPEKSPGLNGFKENDKKFRVDRKTQSLPRPFYPGEKTGRQPFSGMVPGYHGQYKIPHYLEIEKPDRFFMQTVSVG